jgi:uncharacterized cupin superfamily protein
MEEQGRSPQSGIIKGKPDNAGNRRIFIDGSTRSYAALRTAAIGWGTYRPGWRWSTHAGAQLGKSSENHIGYIVSGRMMVKEPNGNEGEVGPGEAFEISAGSDAWVIGNEPCVALDFILIAK